MNGGKIYSKETFLGAIMKKIWYFLGGSEKGICCHGFKTDLVPDLVYDIDFKYIESFSASCFYFYSRLWFLLTKLGF